MQKKMLIDATHVEETRVVVVEGNRVEEFDYETVNKRQITGNIYLAKVTRVEPSLQAAFVEYGGNRHGFLAFSEIHPDYYQIPVADREALLAEEAEFASRMDDEEQDEKPKQRSRRRRGRSGSVAERQGAAAGGDSIATFDAPGPDLVDDPDGVAQADAHQPSAASGEKPVDVFEEPEEDDHEAGEGDTSPTAAAPAELEVVETSAPNDMKDDIAVRRARPRRYKIQEVIKVRQILLVQVVKEERGNKGAALTTYLSLPGRYCVLMPNTARGGGISRKITNAADRKKLKEIAGSMTVPKGAGLIIRTAGAQRTKSEVKRDYEYLMRMWEQIRDLTLRSIAPALIYEEGNLIRRAIRDLYSRDIDEIFVEGERGYREAKDYMKMLMPSHAKNVKPYVDSLPMFARHQVEGYLAGMFNPVVQLKSGGYIVINVTEALVAIDVNSGRATKEGSIEDTALKTNLEAAEEVARQMRLRDLAGLLVIDFIDMEDRRNITAVEKRLKEKLKNDRARIQLGRISAFGLLELSRQRLRPGMLEAVTASCPHCHGTGRIRSDESLALAIMRELEEEGVRARSKEVLVTAPVGIANYILNAKRDHVTLIESRFGMAIRVEGDSQLISPEYRVERFKTATRIVQIQPDARVVHAHPIIEDEEADIVEDEDEDADTGPGAEAGAESAPADRRPQGRHDSDRDGGKRRRRRRRRRGGRTTDLREVAEDTASAMTVIDDGATSDGAPDVGLVETVEGDDLNAQRPARPRSRTRSRPKAGTAEIPAMSGIPAASDAETSTDAVASIEVLADAGDGTPVPAAEIEEAAQERAAAGRKRPAARRTTRKPAGDDVAPVNTAPAAEVIVPSEAEAVPTPASLEGPIAEPVPAAVPADPVPGSPAKARARASAAETIATVAEAGERPAIAQNGDAATPRRKGWWARALGGG
jgi:ribonuclease E